MSNCTQDHRARRLAHAAVARRAARRQGGTCTGVTHYSTSYSCTNARAGGQAPSGTGASFAITPVTGDDLTCTLANARLAANLSISKVASAAEYVSGSSAVYTITVDNGGPAAANGAVLRDDWSAAPSSGLDCSAGPVRCTASGTAGTQCPASPTPAGLAAGLPIPALPAGGKVTFSLTCRITASGR